MNKLNNNIKIAKTWTLFNSSKISFENMVSSSQELLCMARGNCGGNNCALTMIIPTCILGTTSYYYQITDDYNNNTAIHMQIFMNKTGYSSYGLWFGQAQITSAEFAIYYK